MDCSAPEALHRREAKVNSHYQGVCGDQHLAVVVQHGIDKFRDGPFGFTNPAIVNSYYGRWWWPENEQPGGCPIPGSPQPWTGDYLDGLYNRIRMIAYANPEFGDIWTLRSKQRDPDANLGDGYGLIRFNKRKRAITFECWPRYADLNRGEAAQFPGWPVTIRMEDNDGRRINGYLPELRFRGAANPVVQVIRESDGETLYTQRIAGRRFRPGVFAPGSYTVKVGRDTPDGWIKQGLTPAGERTPALTVKLR